MTGVAGRGSGSQAGRSAALVRRAMGSPWCGYRGWDGCVSRYGYRSDQLVFVLGIISQRLQMAQCAIDDFARMVVQGRVLQQLYAQQHDGHCGDQPGFGVALQTANRHREITDGKREW